MAKKAFLILSQFSSNNKNDNYSHKQPENCPRCGSVNLSKGAGLKPGQISLKCSECKTFIGYRNLQQLKRQKDLTTCLEFLETCNISGDVLAIFVLGEVEA